MSTAWRELSDLTIIRGVQTVKYSDKINIATRIVADGMIPNVLVACFAGRYLPGMWGGFPEPIDPFDMNTINGIRYDYMFAVEDFYMMQHISRAMAVNLTSGVQYNDYSSISVDDAIYYYGTPKIMDILVVIIQLSQSITWTGGINLSDYVVDVKDAVIVTNMIEI